MTSLRSSCRRLRMPVLILPLCCVAFLSPRPARAADAPWEQDSPARPVLTPGALGMRSGPTEDVAPGAAPVPRTYFASPGTTFDDLVRQGILPDPRERPRAHTQVDLDPGAYPEGDNIGWAAFTRAASCCASATRACFCSFGAAATVLPNAFCSARRLSNSPIDARRAPSAAMALSTMSTDAPRDSCERLTASGSSRSS